MVLESNYSTSGQREAYISYGAWSNEHTQTIERLNDNFTNSLGAVASSGPISPPNNEAPILFHRRGWFYLLFGNTCCFCREGADTQVLKLIYFPYISQICYLLKSHTGLGCANTARTLFFSSTVESASAWQSDLPHYSRSE